LPSTPGFDDADLLGTLTSFPFAGVDSDLSADERFARGVAQAVRACLRAHPGREGSHAVFLLEPSVPERLPTGSGVPYFALDDGETDVTSGMWFVGPPVICGVRVDAPATFDEMFPAVVAAGLGEVIAVTYRLTKAGPTLRYYPHGLGDPERKVSMTLSDNTVDLAKILELIDIVHRSILVTPSGHQGGAKLWQDRSKHHPVRHVEVEIQAYADRALCRNATLPN